MNRREYLKTMAALGAAGLFDRAGFAGESVKRPNVLVIMTDQNRYNCLGCYGNKQVKTPNIDRLAGDSVRYDNSFCSYAVCTPSRYSFLTGQPVYRHRGYTNHCTLPPGTETFAGLLKRAGYHTAAVGKMHLTPTYFDVGFETMCLAEQNGPGRWDDDYHRYLQENGVVDRNDLIDQEEEYRKSADKDYWDSYGAIPSNLPDVHHSTTWTGDKAVAELETWDSDKPHLLMASFIKPHHPFDPPEKWATMYDIDQIDILPGWTDTCPQQDVREGYFLNTGLTEKALKKITAYYYAAITQIDFHVGRMIDVLKKRGLYDNSIILFTSDHGEHLGFHHMLLKGGHLYDSIAKVPLLIKYPGSQKSGTSTDRLVSNVDIAPTLLGLAGQKIPKAMQGLDLLGNHEREIVFVEGNQLNTVMARTKTKKLILKREKNAGEAIEYRGLLYDLEKDPLELNDLYGRPEYSGQQKKLTEAIDNWLPVSASRDVYLNEDAPVINQPNVLKHNDGHREAMMKYFKSKV